MTDSQAVHSRENCSSCLELHRLLAAEQAKTTKLQGLLHEWAETYERWTVENFKLAPHAEVLQRDLEAAESRLSLIVGYVRHKQGCTEGPCYEGGRSPCSCGLDAALKEGK